ncbi:GIY-YIG nuclease family protein [Streptomyces sp. NBC_01224]|uniref:GIY-YIG nuclease family protein n=1 Tax=Streptomyces sp. NBC_01224 TaxID=2903783 RepID=UPI003FA39AB8
MLPHGKVYVVGQRGSGVAKIGTSVNLKQRVPSLQAGNPLVLEALGTYRGGVGLERYLHDLFEDRRGREHGSTSVTTTLPALWTTRSSKVSRALPKPGSLLTPRRPYASSPQARSVSGDSSETSRPSEYFPT